MSRLGHVGKCQSRTVPHACVALKVHRRVRIKPERSAISEAFLSLKLPWLLCSSEDCQLLRRVGGLATCSWLLRGRMLNCGRGRASLQVARQKTNRLQKAAKAYNRRIRGRKGMSIKLKEKKKEILTTNSCGEAPLTVLSFSSSR